MADDKEPKCPQALTSRGYKLGEEIGFGVYSTVYKAYIDSKPGRVIACKRIDTELVPQKWREKCMKLELKILKKVSHPNIVRVWDLIKTRKTVFIFMDLCVNSSIFKLLEKEKKPFDELRAKIWFSQILSALSYCHAKGVAHRDIKLDNFLLNKDSDALLTDFGFSTLAHDKSGEIMRDTSCGHPAYMAPEVFDEAKIWPYNAKAADMYSMGVCLFEMLNFDKPFDANSALTNQMKHVMKQRNRRYKLHKKVEQTISQPIKQLIDRLLDPNPGTRITSDQCLVNEGIIPFPEENPLVKESKL